MKKFASLLTITAAIILVGAGCASTTNPPASPQASAATGRAVVAITDASTSLAGITAVVVTVNKVEIHSTTAGWVTLSTAAKTYDLLQLKNASLTKVLADMNVATGTYEQVRLGISKVELTTADGKVKTAKLPSNTLRIVGNFSIAADQTSTAVLDFNLEKSLRLTGNGVYILAPVVRLQTKTDATVTAKPDQTIEINGGKTETDKTVGVDASGETKDNFELPANLDIDADGRIEINDNENRDKNTNRNENTNRNIDINIR